jgi:hypothetical protein
VPLLVTGLLGVEVEAVAEQWKSARLHAAGRGYSRKLLFLLIAARTDGLQGVVATVDQDRSDPRERLQELQDARIRDRDRRAPLPAALGCARPHAEAWLLDDPVAVRAALELPHDVPLPRVDATRNPKAILDQLCSSSRLGGSSNLRLLLAEIAGRVDISRCQHARQTGFAEFAADVRAELGPLRSRR